MKTKLAWLILLLLPTILLPVFIGQTKAANSFYAWGAMQDITQPPWEYNYQIQICQYVTSWMPTSWTRIDNYEGGTYPSNVYSALSNNRNNHINGHTLWVGDFAPQFDYDGSQHWSFYSGYYHHTEFTWDSSIYYYVGFNPIYEKTEFIWTCSCGGLYFNQQYPTTPHYATSHDSPYIWYGWYDGTTNKAVGMPYAWSGIQYMQTDGYINYYNNDPTAYIGWENASPALVSYAPNTQTTNYWFLYWYYYYATGKYDGAYHSCRASLDWASQKIWSTSFGGSPYWYGWFNPSWGTWTRLRAMGNQNQLVLW